MKKILFIFVILLLFICNLKAKSFSFDVNCPTSIEKNTSFSCSISVTPKDFTLKGIQSSLNIENGIYESFNVTDSFTQYTNNENGFSLIKKSPSKVNASLGTLKVKSLENNINITFSSIVASNTETEESILLNDITKIIRIKSDINTLDNMIVGGCSLNPIFSSEETNYKVTTQSSQTIIAAVKSDDYSSVSGLGKKDLNYGENIFKIVVTSESGISKTYKIIITREDNREKVNTLSSLNVVGYKLNEEFNKNTLSYSLNVNSNVTSVRIDASKEGLNSYFVTDYNPRSVNLNYGINIVFIKVKSESEEIKTYKINITRIDNRNSNNYLKSLNVSDGDFVFEPDKNEFALTVKNEIKNITVYAESENKLSTIKGTGTYKLNVGNNKIKVIVTAENESKRIYTLNVIRLDENNITSSNLSIKSLSIKNYDINFNENISIYNITIENETSLEFNYELENPTSTIILNGNEDLKDGSIITLQVFSSSGQTKEYKFNISKSKIETDEKQNNQNSNIFYKKIIGASSLTTIIVVSIILINLFIKKKNSII